MGIDYFVCNVCGEPFPDVIDYGSCYGCGSTLCEDCRDDMAVLYGVLGEDHADVIAGMYPESDPLWCNTCANERTVADLYVLANVDEGGNIVGYPKGGGSSTASRIKAYDSLESAKRGARRHSGVIVRITNAEVVE